MTMPETQLLAYMCKKFSMPYAMPYGRAAAGLAATLVVWRGDRKGIKVALPAMTCHDVLAAVIASECEPILCDIGINDGLVSEVTWRNAIESGADAIILVHSFGNPANGREIRSLCDKAGILLIDDAAQALGSAYRGTLAGSSGHVGVFSFGPTKHISIGGGVLLYEDARLASAAYEYANNVLSIDENQCNSITQQFREGYFLAKERLSVNYNAASREFCGLLDDYGPVLWPRWNKAWAAGILQQLELYQDAVLSRRRLSGKWDALLSGHGAVPVGMGEGCVPWRYTCRLPGLTWEAQRRISERVRAGGTHLSNWYTPLAWFMGLDAEQATPQSLRLAREVFQFWVAPDTTTADIKAGSANFCAAIEKYWSPVST